jgi:hypothetical protein
MQKKFSTPAFEWKSVVSILRSHRFKVALSTNRRDEFSNVWIFATSLAKVLHFCS